MGLVKIDVEMIDLLPGPGFEQDQLEAAFGEVCHAQRARLGHHWKDAIDCWVPVEDLDLVRAAIIHFTGSVLEEGAYMAHGGGWVHIQSAGYWAVIGA